MKLNCRLSTNFSYNEIQQLFASELGRQHERSEIQILNEKNKAVFEITATDMTAMRATLNSVTGILAVYARTHEKHARNAKH